MAGMGTIHKFTPPPKNEQQFKGYRPLGANGLTPKKARSRSAFWARLRPWQQSVLVWALLIAAAAIIVGIGALFRH